MRYLVGFLFVCALGLMPLVGCFEGLQSGSCNGVECPDDGNECTTEFCRCDGWWCTPECVSAPVDNGTDCTFDSAAGVCVEGVCGENLCEGVVCDDDDACTDNECDYVDGTCDFPPAICDDGSECTQDTCNPADGCIFTPVEDGTFCETVDGIGTCEAGVCTGHCDPASEEILPCPIEGAGDLFLCCPGWERCLDDCSTSP